MDILWITAVLRIRIRVRRIRKFFGLLDPDPDSLVIGSVADPNPDPRVFGPPGSGSTSPGSCSGSGSGSFYHHAKIVRKTLIPIIL